jgi:hypothetical protein
LPSLALNHAGHGSHGSEVELATPVDPPRQDLGIPDDGRKRVGQFVEVERDVGGGESFRGLVFSIERQRTFSALRSL